MTMEAPTPPDPNVVTEVLGLMAKLLAAFAAVILAAMSHVWSVARSAKRCAFDTRVKVEAADALTQTTANAIDGLRKDMRDGFKGVHDRLDRHLNGGGS